MKHLFIVNPKSGKRGSVPPLLEQIHKAAAGLDYEVVMTKGPGDAEDLARTAAQGGEPVRIYVCGGDGTLNEVVNGAAGYPHVAVTNVPTGTGNDFLRIFGKSAHLRFRDLTALIQGPQTAFDLIDCNGRLCIDVACVGIDARVAADVDRYKSLPLVSGIGAYILSLIVNFLFKGISRPATVQVEGECIEGETALVCVCNGRYYGGGFMPVGDAEPDDGILDTLLVPKVTRRTFLRLVGAYAKGRYREYPQYISHYHGKGLSISSREELVAVVDGEVMRDKQFIIALSPLKLNFFYPGDLSYRAASSAKAATL